VVVRGHLHIDSSTIRANGKTYTRHLLRTSYREGGKVKHKTIANLSHYCDAEIEAVRLVLKHKARLPELGFASDVRVKDEKRFGAVWCLYKLAERLKICVALGDDAQGKLALWQVLARLIGQGSRLSAVRLAESHMGCELLGIDRLNEDELYRNLAWLAEHQEQIEDALFRRRYPKQVPSLFLYDVTSSYLEGEKNALAAYGYNRDQKKGKKQIVVGLLTDGAGIPVAVRVFEGNTSDGKTVAEQVQILSKRFGVQEVTLVGDRGMLKGPQIEQLPDGFHYLTAITKPQIRKMLDSSVLQYGFFDERVCEVSHEGIRYLLRRNPVRTEQVRRNREAKLATVERVRLQHNQYLAEHPRASDQAALSKLQAKIRSLKADIYCRAVCQQRKLSAQVDQEALREAALLDGCYVLKTDVAPAVADAETLHARYKDLTEVERAFRSIKTGHLEVRPVYVHREDSTRGHVLVVMLAYLMRRELEHCWQTLDLTIAEGLDEIGSLKAQTVTLGTTSVAQLPEPNARARRLLKAAGVSWPKALPTGQPNVATKKKLPSERKCR
jgi:hypothetical protein